MPNRPSMDLRLAPRSARPVRAATIALVLLATTGTGALAAECGGGFKTWKRGVAEEARAAGVSNRIVDRVVPRLAVSKKVLSRDRRQGVFTQTWVTFASRMANDFRRITAQKKIANNPRLFARVRGEFGVAPEVVAGLWGLETDFSSGMGNFDTLNALATLAHDCRRPELFRPELIAALKLIDTSNVAFAPGVTGAWAGEIGGTQMLPHDILKYGTDGDDDGRIDLKRSGADVVVTTAAFLKGLGWRAGEPWLQEVRVPDNIDWTKAGRDVWLPVAEWERMGVKARDGTLTRGLEAMLLAPMGRKGPKFLAYSNFDVFTEWNKSYTYSLTAAYLATRIAGAPRVDVGSPEQGLDIEQMKRLQTLLAARGHDVGKIDGILGLGTRTAVRAEQARLGLPADSWPTTRLLKALR